MNTINIWTPRYHDDVALIAKYKVKAGDNLIKFTKAPHLKDREFVLTDVQLSGCPMDSNGKIDCYAVPMDLIVAGERRINDRA